jgi:hypothetical protein
MKAYLLCDFRRVQLKDCQQADGVHAVQAAFPVFHLNKPPHGAVHELGKVFLRKSEAVPYGADNLPKGFLLRWVRCAFFKHGNLSPIVFYKGRLFQLLCPVHAWHMQIGEICRIFLGYLRENTLISTCIRYLFVTAV